MSASPDRYLEVLQRWMTPDELDHIRKEVGSAEAIVERKQQIERIIEKAEQREAIWQFLRMAALAFVSIVGLVATIKAILPAGWWP